MPTKKGLKQTAKKAEYPHEPRSKRFITIDACGYKRMIRESKPNEPPFSHAYVAGNIEANLFSVCYTLASAVDVLKDSGLEKIHPGNKYSLGRIETLLRYALILGRHLRGDSDNDYFKEYVSKIDDIEYWNSMFPIENVNEGR